MRITTRQALKELGILKGSLSVSYKRCGNLCSRCREGKGHRCIYFSYRYRGKTVVAHIPKRSEKLARKWQGNYLKLTRVLEEETKKNLEKLRKRA